MTRRAWVLGVTILLASCSSPGGAPRNEETSGPVSPKPAHALHASASTPPTQANGGVPGKDEILYSTQTNCDSSDSNCTYTLWAEDAHGHGAVSLGDGRAPSWSPNGKQIAFRTGEPQQSGVKSEIVVMKADGTNRRVIRTFKSELGGAGPPAWSPSGGQLVFDATNGIWVMNANGKHARKISSYHGPGNFACYDLEPSWSPDGKTIAFAVRCDGAELGIWTMGADGSNRTQIIGPPANNPDEHHQWSNPEFSPDGSQISFSTSSGVSHYSIATMNPDGTGVRIIAKGFSGASWAPDGRTLVFSGSHGLESVGANGSHEKVIGPKNGAEPDWKP